MVKKPSNEPERVPNASLRHNPFASLAKSPLFVTQSAERPRVPEPPEALRPAARAAEYRKCSVRMRLESKGPGGKVVTRITGLPPSNVEAIAGRLRKALGCGGTVDGEDVLLAGSLVERATAWIERAGDLRLVEDEPVQRTPPARPSVRAPDTAAEIPGSSGTKRADVRPGSRVAIVLKADQSTGALTEGIVRDILTSSPVHPRGIKVRLQTGEVGRVKIIRAHP